MGIMRCPRLLPALLVPFLLAACAGQNAAPLPVFALGDSYRFDDGFTRSVAATSDSAVLWHGDGHKALLTSRDVLLPPLTETEPQLTIRRMIDGPDLFPLTPGKRVALQATTERLPHHHGRARVLHETMDCVVGGSLPVDTRAGSFSTVRVDCAVTSAQGDTTERTYFYAPAIGYFVRMEQRDGNGPPHIATLTGYTMGNPALAESAFRRRTRAIQYALERHVSGAPVPWRDPDTGARGDVEPILTVRSQLRGWCREFREHMQTAGRDYHLRGTACRDQSGTWQVQEVTPYRLASR